MAAFIAKQLVGNQIKSVTGAADKATEGEKKDEGGMTEEERLEHEEALREVEERRKEKHRKMEEERESMRQGIRDKYNLKKKEDLGAADPSLDGRLGRKKAEPGGNSMAGLPGVATKEESLIPKDLDDLKEKVSNLPGKMMTTVNDASEKCVLQ